MSVAPAFGELGVAVRSGVVGGNGGKPGVAVCGLRDLPVGV